MSINSLTPPAPTNKSAATPVSPPSILSLLTKFVDANKLGGWVRAIVAAGFVALIAEYPVLGNYVAPAVQTQIAAAIAAIVVGYWSQLTKSDEAKIKMVTDLPGVDTVNINATATDGVAKAAADPTQPKVIQA
jgi:hypothetical protein